MSNGTETIKCDNNSGGVMSAAMTNNTKYAYFRIFAKNIGVTRPSLVINMMTTGI